MWGFDEAAEAAAGVQKWLKEWENENENENGKHKQAAKTSIFIISHERLYVYLALCIL